MAQKLKKDTAKSAEDPEQQQDDENQVREQDGEDGDDQASEVDGPDNIEYERLSEFFFDLCLSWC